MSSNKYIRIAYYLQLFSNKKEYMMYETRERIINSIMLGKSHTHIGILHLHNFKMQRQSTVKQVDSFLEL